MAHFAELESMVDPTGFTSDTQLIVKRVIAVGDDIDVLFSPTGTWARATVINMGHRYVPSKRFLRITYHGLPSRFDKWVCRWSASVAPYQSKSASICHTRLQILGDQSIEKWRLELKKGSVIDAKDTMGNWYKSIIIDTKTT